MEHHFPNASNLRSSSSTFLSFLPRSTVLNKLTQRRKSSSFVVKSTAEASKGLQKESKKNLSRILRTEAAVKGIERKATSSKSIRLSPKAVLKALDDNIRSNQWESALEIFELARKQQWYQPKRQTYIMLIKMLGKCRQPGHASLLFEKMLFEGLKPSIDVYTSLVGAYGISGHLDEAFLIVEEMKSVIDCKPDLYTYSILIHCCTKLHRFDLIDQMLHEMSYLGIRCSIVTYNTIIDGYGKAAMFEQMENLFNDMIETGRCLPDVFTLNSFIWAYGNAGEIKEMERWYDEFQHMGVRPDIKTFNILIRSYGKAGMYEKMENVMGFMEKRFFSPTNVTYNILIEMFGRAQNIEKLEYYFRTMKYKGVKPNSITYCSLVSCYGKIGNLKKVSSILRQVENSDVVLDTPFFNCVIGIYGQAGELKRMEEMFLEMKQRKCKPDTITFATMNQAYNAQGIVKTAQELESVCSQAKKRKGTTTRQFNSTRGSTGNSE